MLASASLAVLVSRPTPTTTTVCCAHLANTLPTTDLVCLAQLAQPLVQEQPTATLAHAVPARTAAPTSVTLALPVPSLALAMPATLVLLTSTQSRELANASPVALAASLPQTSPSAIPVQSTSTHLTTVFASLARLASSPQALALLAARLALADTSSTEVTTVKSALLVPSRMVTESATLALPTSMLALASVRATLVVLARR